LKQEQIAHEQTKRDLLALEEKDKDNEQFLIKEAKRSKKLNEELSSTKDQLKDQENELRKTVELLKSRFLIILEFTEENVDLKKSLQQAKIPTGPQTPVNSAIPQSNGKPIDPKKMIFDSDEEKSSQMTPDLRLKDAGKKGIIIEIAVKEMEIKVGQLEVALQQKDEESAEIKTLYEKSAAQIQQLQDVVSVVSLGTDRAFQEE
jgi:hypothetical protein